MKLLFDQNIFPRVIQEIEDLYPGSEHVQSIGLAKAKDSEIREYAKMKDLMIISKDADFSDRAVLVSPPPKVIWIKKGNCSTKEIIELLRNETSEIKKFADNPNSGLFILI